MQHILIPTDFSDLAINAYRYGLGIAEKYGSKLTLLHVYHYPVVDPYMPGSMIESINNEQEEQALEHFREYEELMPGNVLSTTASRIKVDHILKTGFVVPEVIRTSEEIEADMIIMGTAGASGIAEILLGSNTASVIENAKIPVLSIPENARFNGFERIVYASDFEKVDFKSLGTLLKFASLFQAKVRCLHIKTDDSLWDDVHFDDWNEYYWNEVKAGLIKFDMIKDEDVLKGLNEFIKEHEIDLLAMVTHKKKLREKIFGKSLTRKMAFHSNIPLWAFHAI